MEAVMFHVKQYIELVVLELFCSEFAVLAVFAVIHVVPVSDACSKKILIRFPRRLGCFMVRIVPC